MKQRPIRVMRIITRLNVGGPSYQAIFLTQRLRQPEFESELMIGNCAPEEGTMEPLAEERGVGFTRVPGLGREISIKSDLGTVAHLYREIRRFRPDIVHTHLAKAGTAGRLAARMAGVPAVVHTYHGHVFHGYFSKRKTQLFIRIERALAKWTDRIVVLGEAQEREILSFGVGRADQMVRIPLGLELEPMLRCEEHRGKLRSLIGAGPSAPLVGIVARMVPIKRHDLFLQAARRVAQAKPEAEFVLVGDGELRDPILRQAQAEGFRILDHSGAAGSYAGGPENGPRLHFLGFRTNLAELYADLDAVVLCSDNEGLPVAVIESLAAGRPVVATEVGAVRDLVAPGETGELVRVGDVEGLAEGILRLIRDPERSAEMARAGRSRVYPRLSIDRLEEDIRALYRDLYREKVESRGR